MTYLAELARKEKTRKLNMLLTVLAVMIGAVIAGAGLGVLVELGYRAISHSMGLPY